MHTLQGPDSNQPDSGVEGRRTGADVSTAAQESEDDDLLVVKRRDVLSSIPSTMDAAAGSTGCACAPAPRRFPSIDVLLSCVIVPCNAVCMQRRSARACEVQEEKEDED